MYYQPTLLAPRYRQTESCGFDVFVPACGFFLSLVLSRSEVRHGMCRE